MSISKAMTDLPSEVIPKPFLVHGALVTVQTIFGVGSVVGALGLPAFNPLVFALIREIFAGFLLLAASIAATKLWPTAGITHWRRFAGLGFFIFMNQACVIIGIKLSDAVAGSIWQPSQPIMTAAICMMMGWEPINSKRIVGILIAFLGCAFMVAFSDSNSDSSNSNGIGSQIAGNIFFFFNCLGTALYVIFSKKALIIFPSICVTAWSYLFAMLYMTIITLLFSLSNSLMHFLCSDCHSNPWYIPKDAIWALSYWIIFNSALAYSLLTWANKYATGTLVMGYSVLQPITALCLTMILIYTKTYLDCNNVKDDDDEVCLGGIGWGDFGAFGVFIGLYIIIKTEPIDSNSSNGIISSTNSHGSFLDRSFLEPFNDPPAYTRSASYTRSPFIGDPDDPNRDSGISQSFTDFSGCDSNSSFDYHPHHQGGHRGERNSAGGSSAYSSGGKPHFLYNADHDISSDNGNPPRRFMNQTPSEYSSEDTQDQSKQMSFSHYSHVDEDEHNTV
mmetsp:Transcript_29111/g.37565  ORF Transcript_29111/g.37565 Transcript_29111/m.37565 type:complete len:504 (-) Transcript_29111:152-1663(-)